MAVVLLKAPIMKFFARRLPRPSRRWILENAHGYRMPSVDAATTYEELLAHARLAGFSSLDIELKYPKPMRHEDLVREVNDAMWAGDIELLDEIARCICCCHEHTFDGCPARLWEGCRGSGQMTQADVESWVRHYTEHHAMTRDQFFGDATGHNLTN